MPQLKKERDAITKTTDDALEKSQGAMRPNVSFVPIGGLRNVRLMGSETAKITLEEGEIEQGVDTNVIESRRSSRSKGFHKK